MKRVLLFILLTPSVSFSFEFRKCMDGTRDYVIPFDSFLSTSSFFTSTGDCSMIGLSPVDEAKLFVAQNIVKLRSDSARERGEYLFSFINLASCNDHTVHNLPIQIQKNLQLIYGRDLKRKTEAVYEEINNLLANDISLQCKNLGS